jgi:PadR family transcriptional regulator
MSPRERGLLPGTVDLVILKTLCQGPLHGFAISRSLRESSDGILDLKDAALYQALHRIERQGWIKAEWGVSDNNRRAKFYEVTRSGVKRLKSETSSFQEYASAVFKVLNDPTTAPEGQGG